MGPISKTYCRVIINNRRFADEKTEQRASLPPADNHRPRQWKSRVQIQPEPDPQMIYSLSKTAGSPSPCFLDDTSSFTASGLHATCGHHCSTVAHTLSWLLSLSATPPSSGMCEQPCSQVHRGHSSVQRCRDQAVPTGPLCHQLLLRPGRAPEVSAPHLLASTSCSHWFRPPLPPSQGVAVALQPVTSSTCGH